MVVAPSTNALRRQQPALSEREELAKRADVLTGRACSRLRDCPLGCQYRHHFPVSLPKCTAHSWGCFLLLRVRDRSTQRRLQALGQLLVFCRQAGPLEDCQGRATLLLNSYMGALPGYRHTEAISTLMGCSHTVGIGPGWRYSEDTALCWGTGTPGTRARPGVLGQVLAEVHRVGCHLGTSAVPG